VIEEALRNKYSNQLEVQTFFLITSDMDTETDKDIEERPVHPHHIVRFRVPGKDWHTIDAVYRQFQFRVKPYKMLIIPTKNEKKLYTYKQWHRRMLDKNSDETWKYLPQKRKPRELHEHHLEMAKNGELKGVTEEDYMSLFESFSK